MRRHNGFDESNSNLLSAYKGFDAYNRIQHKTVLDLYAVAQSVPTVLL